MNYIAPIKICTNKKKNTKEKSKIYRLLCDAVSEVVSQRAFLKQFIEIFLFVEIINFLTSCVTTDRTAIKPVKIYAT